MEDPSSLETLSKLHLAFDRDTFLLSIIRELSGTLEDVVGLKEASGFMNVVGQSLGDEINAAFKSAMGVAELSQEQIPNVLVELKRRVGGDFFLMSESAEQIVLGNRACPFGEKVLGHPSMCMMTSNVFGVIAAQNLGYAKVQLQETIAQGNAGCRVVVYLKPDERAASADGREYFQSAK